MLNFLKKLLPFFLTKKLEVSERIIEENLLEIKTKKPDGTFRFFYVVPTKGGKKVVHAFNSKLPSPGLKEIEIAKDWLRYYSPVVFSPLKAVVQKF